MATPIIAHHPEGHVEFGPAELYVVAGRMIRGRIAFAADAISSSWMLGPDEPL
jgi:hypothetical protein